MIADVAFDIGSKYLSISKFGTGIYFKEPCVVAVDNNNTIKAIGVNALRLKQKDPNFKILNPITEGAINNKLFTEEILKHLLKKASVFESAKVRAVCAVSIGLNNNDKKIIEEVFLKLGVRQTVFVESALADFSIAKKEFNINSGIVVNIGGAITEIASIKNDEILNGCSLYIAGNQIDRAIANYAEKKCKTIISFENAEKVKLNCGSLFVNDVSSFSVEGINIDKDSVEVLEITAREIYDTISEKIDKIISVIESVVLSLKDSGFNDIVESGIIICGGGSNLLGLEKYFINKLKMPIRLLQDSENSTIKGVINITNK